jgi:hypothetical protein
MRNSGGYTALTRLLQLAAVVVAVFVWRDLQNQIVGLSAQVAQLQASAASGSRDGRSSTRPSRVSVAAVESLPPSLQLFGSEQARPQNQKNTAVGDKPQARVTTGGTYDGGNDAQHLGGATKNDTMGQSPALYTYLVKNINVRSVIDVGCGRGISTRWFHDHNVDVLCVEGSHDTVAKSYLPPDKIVEHDFALGPWWPAKTYDLAWCVEVLEHVGRHNMRNYLPIFHRSAIIMVTHAMTGGHHHVETHEPDWWIDRLQMQGFVYSPRLTDAFKARATESTDDGFNAQHLWRTTLVFLNPKVASKYDHAHLMGDPGCFTQAEGSFPCGTTPGHAVNHRNAQGRTPSDTLPPRFLPAFVTPTKWDDKWSKTYVPEGAECARYPFPTWHDGC